MPATDAAPTIEGLADDLVLIRSAAAEAGRIAMRYFRTPQDVWMKTGNSPVGEADYAVDKYLRETLLAARPGYGWLSEETADTSERLTARRTFVVDPIDGTRGFIDGGDVWCVSIAVVEDGRSLAGVLDCPAKEAVFEATLGGGAWRNGERLEVGENRRQPVIGGPKAMIERLPESLRLRATIRGHVPSLAYRLALVATGEIDATFVKPNSHDWDIAAADLILSEAGGTLWDGTGRRPRLAEADPRHGALVAGHGKLLDALAAVISSN